MRAPILTITRNPNGGGIIEFPTDHSLNVVVGMIECATYHLHDPTRTVLVMFPEDLRQRTAEESAADAMKRARALASHPEVQPE